jgi:hypothetical protein
MAPEVRFGQKGMKCIFITKIFFFIWAKVTQVSDVAHGFIEFYDKIYSKPSA